MVSSYIRKNKFFIGLFAYLVQAERSLHRAINADWSEFITIYHHGLFVPPMIVMRELESRFSSLEIEYDDLQNSIEVYVSQHRLQKFSLRFVAGFLKKNPILTHEEARLIFSALHRFHHIIELKSEPTNQTKIGVRQIIYLASLIMKDKILSFSSINKHVEMVEHFYQNEYKNFLTIDEIVGNEWLK